MGPGYLGDLPVVTRFTDVHTNVHVEARPQRHLIRSQWRQGRWRSSRSWWTVVEVGCGRSGALWLLHFDAAPVDRLVAAVSWMSQAGRAVASAAVRRAWRIIIVHDLVKW